MYKYLHRSNVAAAVFSFSATIWLSKGDVFLAFVSLCVRGYTNIYIEITLHPLCPPEYG